MVLADFGGVWARLVDPQTSRLAVLLSSALDWSHTPVLLALVPDLIHVDLFGFLEAKHHVLLLGYILNSFV